MMENPFLNPAIVALYNINHVYFKIQKIKKRELEKLLALVVKPTTIMEWAALTSLSIIFSKYNCNRRAEISREDWR